LEGSLPVDTSTTTNESTTCVSAGSDNLLLVMEYVEGESLHPRRIDPTHWERVPEPEVWRRTRDVLQGLDYLHFHGVVHGGEHVQLTLLPSMMCMFMRWAGTGAAA
jgi:serine/threonine protein kinase